jgi:hypothetical protein
MGYPVAYRWVAHFHEVARIGMTGLVGQGNKVGHTGSSILSI